MCLPRKNIYQDKTFYTIVIVALFKIFRNYKQPKYSQISEWTADALNNMNVFQKYCNEGRETDIIF